MSTKKLVNLWVIFGILSLGELKAQGFDITIIKPASDTTVCSTSSIYFEAIQPFLITDFDNGAIGTGWSSTLANPVFNNPCGAGPKSFHLWVGTTPSSQRSLITNTYDLTQGGACYIEFWMRYGRVANAGPCEDPDASTEGVWLEYSTNNGATWSAFPGPNVNPVGNTSTAPPFTTSTPGSGYYWTPSFSSSAQAASTLYYWNRYRCNIPASAITTNTSFRWIQKNTSFTGFDAWGIDEVVIGCAPASVLWSTGDTTSTHTTSIGSSGPVWVQATDANGNTVSDTINVTVQRINFSFPQDSLQICADSLLRLDAGAQWQSYRWSNGSTARRLNVSQSGTYECVVTDTAGCEGRDSVYVQVIRPTDSIAVRDCRPFRVPSGRRRLNTGGNYIDTLSGSGTACDTLVYIDFTRFPARTITQTNFSICQRDSVVTAGGRIIKQTGLYIDTLNSFLGCDSIIETQVNVNPIFEIGDTVYLCQGESYLLPGGQTVNSAGFYSDTLSSLTTCDSIRNTQVIVYPTFHRQDTLTICGGDSVLLPGGYYVSQAGLYRDTLLSRDGCDSVINSRILVNPSFFDQANPAICQGGYYLLPGGDTASSTGIYLDTLRNRFGCDSVWQTNLRVDSVYFRRDSISICQNEPYTLPGGQLVSQPGTYIDSLLSFRGCDSVIETNLYNRPVYRLRDSVSICQRETFQLPGGRVVSVPGTYVDTLQSSLGCDSIWTIRLFQIAEIRSNQMPIICEDEFFRGPSGQTLNQSGVYWDTLMAINGCDSVVRTDLTVLDTQHVYVDTILCYNAVYQSPAGRSLSTTGQYADTLVNRFGCDSIFFIDVAASPNFTISIRRQPDAQCVPIDYLFVDIFGGTPPYDFYWNQRQGATFDTLNPSREGEIILRVSDANFCESIDTIQFRQRANSGVSRLFKDTFALNELPDQLNLRSSGIITSWTWLSDSGAVSNRPHHHFDTDDTGRYRFRIRYRDLEGCSYDTAYTIQVIDPRVEFRMPNAFTPNGDGLNEQFGPVFLADKKEVYELLIFSRWGQKVFEGYNQPWDGFFPGGDPASAGVYTYRLFIYQNDGGTQKHLGTLKLLR